MKLVPALGAHWSAYAERNQVFANDGAGNFRDVSEQNPALCGTPNVARGVCVGDLDNDGALDLLITCIAAPPKLLRNTAPDRGHWLTIRAIDPALGGRDAYGAQVSVVAGGRRRVAWLNPGYSFACSNDPRVHFGLGKNLRAVDSVQILWPDGALENFPGPAADQVVTLRKGAGQPAGR